MKIKTIEFLFIFHWAKDLNQEDSAWQKDWRLWVLEYRKEVEKIYTRIKKAKNKKALQKIRDCKIDIRFPTTKKQDAKISGVEKSFLKTFKFLFHK